MAQDLRSFLDEIKRRWPDDLQVISRPVDPAYEITALVVKLERQGRRRPVLLFENVRGSRFPVLTSHRHSTPSFPPDTRIAPSGDIASARTRPR